MYNAAPDKNALESAGEIKYVDSSEFFLSISNRGKVLVEGIKDSIPGVSIAYQARNGLIEACHVRRILAASS